MTDPAPRYRFTYADDSAYGHVVRLLKELSITSGTVIDLGCGWSPMSEPMGALGLSYIGLEIDTDAIAERTAEGVDVRFCDLTDHKNLADNILAAAPHIDVACVLMTDVLEHIPNADAFLHALADTHQRLGFPPLIISMPNVGHVDLAAKLIAGRWDVRPTGLLDDTHVAFYTEARFLSSLERHGFRQIAASDFRMRRSDQAFPSDLASLGINTPLGQFVRDVRRAADPHETVNQFVRAFSLSPGTASEAPSKAEGERFDGVAEGADTFLSVIMRTQGRRHGLLKDSLTSLAAQTSSDFEVLLVVHSDNEGSIQDVTELVNSFEAGFLQRVKVLSVAEGGRSRPLNVGLDAARGRYVAFLDDDDMALGHWVETFAAGVEAAPGSVVRTLAADQAFTMNDDGTYSPTSGFTQAREKHFDLVTHLHHNETPICCMALPRTTLDGFRLRFDERLPVVEDWDLLIRTALLAGVHDIPEITSLYRRWAQARDSSFAHPQSSWLSAREMVISKLDDAPILLPAGSARRLVELYEQPERQAEIERLMRLNEGLSNHVLALEAHLDLAQGEARAAEERPLWKTAGKKGARTLSGILRRQVR